MKTFDDIIEEGTSFKKCKFCGSKLSEAGAKKQYCDSCDRSLKEGTVKDYNVVAAHQYPSHPYYDRDETDKGARNEFDFAMKDLQKFNTKLKDLEKKSKIDLGKSYENPGVSVSAIDQKDPGTVEVSQIDQKR